MGGCLISIRPLKGQLSIHIYRADPGVVVSSRHDPPIPGRFEVGMPDPTPKHVTKHCLTNCQPKGVRTWKAGHEGQHVAGNSDVIVGLANTN